jgi:NAD(P)-dependent dehydrogenase (short-subunit alcohol dehydrogenase family)
MDDFARDKTHGLVQGFQPADQDAQRAAMMEQTPLGRFGQPDGATRFLASSDPSFVNDSVFLADGGVVATR